MRAISLHPDVLVATSALWQTNCVILRGPLEDADEAFVSADRPGASGRSGGPGQPGAPGQPDAGETFVIDSPLLPDELDALPTLIAQARFPAPSGLLATHGDWDHLLGRLAFPDAALGCALDTAERLHCEPGAAQRELRLFDEQHFIDRDRPLSLGAIQGLPVPGSCDLGARTLELYPAAGHTGEGMSVLIGWADVLLVGDYLSTVELPVLGTAGSLDAYAATLERLRALIERVEHVVPGHGPVLDRARALALLDDDLADVVAGRPSVATRLRRSSRSARPPRSARPR